MNLFIYSTLFRKSIASASGLFLVIFLIGHLIGNLQLIFYTGEIAQKKFNLYAAFMTTNPIIKTLSYLTYTSILIHTIITMFLVYKSKKARPVSYQINPESLNSSWISRNMPLLGTVILIFIIIHMKSFWYEMHFGIIPKDIWGNKDLYTITTIAFKELWYTSFYVISIIFIGMHLLHGIESSFQTIGLKNRKYRKSIKIFSTILATSLAFLFAIIPIILYIRS